MTLFAHCYVSEACTAPTRQGLASLLEHAQAFNRKHGLTGSLVYDGGNYAQVIEGSEGEVSALMNRIARDDRHRSLRSVWSGPVEKPMFESWSMGGFNLVGDLSGERVSIQALHRELTRSIALAETQLGSFPAYFRFCLACQRAGSEPEEITLEMPRFMAG